MRSPKTRRLAESRQKFTPTNPSIDLPPITITTTDQKEYLYGRWYFPNRVPSRVWFWSRIFHSHDGTHLFVLCLMLYGTSQYHLSTSSWTNSCIYISSFLFFSFPLFFSAFVLHRSVSFTILDSSLMIWRPTFDTALYWPMRQGYIASRGGRCEQQPNRDGPSWPVVTLGARASRTGD